MLRGDSRNLTPTTNDAIASEQLLQSIDRPKRQIVTAACQQCRKSKSKCDSNRPCGTCKRRGTACVFLVNENETHSQAAKRKYNEVVHANEVFSELYSLIGTLSDNEASRIFQRIRSGDPPSSILNFIQHGNVDDPASSIIEYKAKQRLLVSLVQSTAPLQELVTWSRPIINSWQKLSIPTGKPYQSLRHRIIKLDYLRSVIRGQSTGPQLQSSDSSAFLDTTSALHHHQETYTATPYAPPFWVPASPWTVLTADDGAVSQLVSLFIVFLNDHWRHVEVDLFVPAMQSGHLESLYCSPLLVNSICAWTSQHSEFDISFTRQDDFLTRGKNFFHEAQRLWALEEYNPSITNIQALMILGSDAAIRGNDKLGIQYTSQAVQLLRQLRLTESQAFDDHVSRENYKRATTCLHWGVIYLDMTFALSLLQPRTDPSWNLEFLPRLSDILPDSPGQWTAYPFANIPIPYRKDRLFIEVSQMAKILRKVVQLLLYNAKKMNAHDLYHDVQALGAEFVKWHKDLPTELKDINTAPAPVYEVIGFYHCTVTMLYTKAKSVLDASQTRSTALIDPEVEEPDDNVAPIKLLAQAAYHACEGAKIIQHHRETYGVKIISPSLWQTSIISAFTMLQIMGAGIVHTDIIFEELRLRHGEYSTPEIESAFVECFRFLLGSALQHMFARGIVRMMFHTSRQLGIEHPGLATRMLAITQDSAWSPSNIDQISSVYPNIALLNGSDTDNPSMEILLRKWEALEIEQKSTQEAVQSNVEGTS